MAGCKNSLILISTAIGPATHEIDAVVTDILRPNGLAFSPDEVILYVSDTSAFDILEGAHHIRTYDLVDNCQTTNGHMFAAIAPGQPDGLWVDLVGNVFTSSENSVQIYTPDGTWIGKIFVPETVTNLTFGGCDRHCLFIVASRSYVRSISTLKAGINHRSNLNSSGEITNRKS